MSTAESVTGAVTLTGRISALQLHANGFHVFPVDHPRQPKCIGKHGPETPCDGKRGKHPAVKWSVWGVAPTPQMIDLEWGRHRGLANIGIACGPSGLVVLDEDGVAETDRWCADRGIVLPPTYVVTTGRGRHLYFGWNHADNPISNRETAFAGYKINVRGHGGFVVGEGSRHENGALYTGNGHPIADLPQQVADLLLSTGRTGDRPEPVKTDHSPGTKIPFGKRHNALVRYASRLRKSGLDCTEVEPVFRRRWQLCEQPEGQIPEAMFHSTDCPYPVTWDEARAKLHDVFGRYPAGQNLHELPAVETARLADVEPEHVSWLWPGWLPVGKLVTLDGDPGVGKSTLVLALAAPITGAGRWPDGGSCEHPGAVLISSAEDGLADTIRPRLDAAGADVTKVHAIKGVPIDTEGTLRPPTVADIAALESAITQTGARLLIIDVLMAHMPSATDSHKDQDSRTVLSPLAKLAERTGCTVVLLRHLNKTGGRSAVYRGGGSIGIIGAARVGMLVAADPEDEGRRVLASVKSNLAPTPESLVFRLVDSPEHGCARVMWDGASKHTAQTLLADTDGDPGAETEARNWLEDYLSVNAPAPSADVKKEAAKLGISDRTLKRAAKNLDVQYAATGFPRITRWSLPPSWAKGSSAKKLGPTDPTDDDQDEQGGGSVLQFPVGPDMNGGPSGRSGSETVFAGKGHAACSVCGKPVTSRQVDATGNPAHLSCQTGGGNNA